MHWRLRGLMLCALIAWVSGIRAAPSPPQDEISWLERYSDALREAKRTQKPILIEFRCEA